MSKDLEAATLNVVGARCSEYYFEGTDPVARTNERSSNPALCREDTWTADSTSKEVQDILLLGAYDPALILPLAYNSAAIEALHARETLRQTIFTTPQVSNKKNEYNE